MENIKIKINLKPNHKNLLANADVRITTPELGTIVLKDFQIWKSPNLNTRLGDAINIRPPSVNVYGKFLPRIFFENKEAWFELESQIWHDFQVEDLKTESAPTPTEVKVPEDIIIPDDMPF